MIIYPSLQIIILEKAHRHKITRKIKLKLISSTTIIKLITRNSYIPQYSKSIKTMTTSLSSMASGEGLAQKRIDLILRLKKISLISLNTSSLLVNPIPLRVKSLSLLVVLIKEVHLLSIIQCKIMVVKVPKIFKPIKTYLKRIVNAFRKIILTLTKYLTNKLSSSTLQHVLHSKTM